MTFTVDKLQGSLYKADSDPSKSERLLVQLVADHFQFDFYLKQYEMSAEVVLKALNIEDQIDEDPSPEFKKIITSEQHDSNSDLMHVKFVKVNKASPEYMTTYEAIDTKRGRLDIYHQCCCHKENTLDTIGFRGYDFYRPPTHLRNLLLI